MEQNMTTDLNLIEHIFVVMMENRSFDHMLGYLDLPPRNVDIQGIDHAVKHGYANLYQGKPYVPQLRSDPAVPVDPNHEREHVRRQMQWDANDPMMSGFIRDYATVSPNDPFGVGQYYGAANLPAMDFFAKHFCVCDQWFSCVPASTQPNRLIAMSGYALLDHTLQQFLDDQENIIYDWLDLHGVSWRVYSEDVPFFTLMPKVRKRILSDIWGHHFRGTVALQHDFNANDTFPQVVFIEPAYSDGPRPERGDDDHPTTPVTRGQEFLLRIYNTLIQNKARWGKSVLIITYDEHGGFFDHIQPPPLITRQGHGERYDHFTTLGVRVPALIISPFVDEGRPFHGILDHTSILKLFAEKFGKLGERYSEDVAARTLVQSVSAVLTREAADSGRFPQPPVIPPHFGVQEPALPGAMLSPNQLAFRNALEEMRQTNPESAAIRFPHWSEYFLRGR
jgi:phospholipase C